MISVIIPFHNERENLPILIPRLKEELHKLGSYEVILVDDGSTDNYAEDIKSLIDNKQVQLVKMGKQMGKGKALNAGLDTAQGEFMVFMDADLQDDPGDLSAFKKKMDEGYDLVNGVRYDRKDNLVIKLYSGLAGWFLKTFLGSPFTDINCGFKMFRSKITKHIPLYGNNFRFFPLAAYYEGYKVTEVNVHNKPRIHGKSKFGISKLFIGLIDMLSAYFLYRFAERPLHFFGSIGAIFVALGGVVLVVVTYQRIFEGILLYRRPVLQYSIFLIILGVQIVMTGIIGELLVYLLKKKEK